MWDLNCSKFLIVFCSDWDGGGTGEAGGWQETPGGKTEKQNGGGKNNWKMKVGK